MKLLPFIFLLVCAAPLSGKETVMTGIDVLEKENFLRLAGRRIGLITNHTGMDAKGRSDAEAMLESGKVRLVKLFSPEHGFSGKAGHGAAVAHSTDAATGLPVISLYGKDRRPTPEMLKGIDLLVFDIQDVGTRFYTYLTTMGYALEEASARGIGFMVLDRPDPITGSILEGPVLAGDISAFTAYFPVPVRHGFTPGEMALFHASARGLKTEISVVKMEKWKRNMWFDETGLTWVNPSPNIRSVEAAALYSGIGCFEATNISVGRGTGSPFTWFGAPWMETGKLEKLLAGARLGGVKFRREKRKPTEDIYSGQECEGIGLRITGRDRLRPLDIFIYSLCYLRDTRQGGMKINWPEMRKMTGTDSFEKLFTEGAPPEIILGVFAESRKNFEAGRARFLLYE